MTEHEKSYPVTFVTKKDLYELAPEFGHCIEVLSDLDMTALANGLGEAIQLTVRSTLFYMLYDYFHKRGCIGTDELDETENDRTESIYD